MIYPIVAAVPMPVLPTVAGLPFFVVVGLAIAALLVWQALTGFKVINLGRRFGKIHPYAGLTAVLLLLLHVPYGLQAMGII